MAGYIIALCIGLVGLGLCMIVVSLLMLAFER